MSAPGRRIRFGFSLALVATLFTLLVGFVHKSQCLLGDFNERAFGGISCYTDLIPLYRGAGLAEGKIPYLEARNEYPVGTGLFMWATSLPGRGEGDYFLTNAVALSGLAVLVAWILYWLVDRRALFFSLAPTLALGAFLNWDLLAVALATGATFAFLSRRDRAAGVLLGLGAAAKAFPALLLVPFALQRLIEGERRSAIRMFGWAGASWALLNAPFAALATERWSFVFPFSSERGPTPGTLWYVGCRALAGEGDCLAVGLVNGLSLALLTLGVTLVVIAVRRTEAPIWTLGLPLLALLLLTSKVYSPQYSLWLLPWFALVLPDLRVFILFQAADVAVFFAEFAWIGAIASDPTSSIWSLGLAVLARAAALVAVVVAYVRRGPGELPAGATLAGRVVSA